MHRRVNKFEVLQIVLKEMLPKKCTRAERLDKRSDPRVKPQITEMINTV